MIRQYDIGGIISLRNAKFSDEKLHDQVRDFMDDISAPVRIETASWLASASNKHRNEALAVLVSALNLKDWSSALRACRAIELLGEKAKPTLPVMRKTLRLHSTREGRRKFLHRFFFRRFFGKAWRDYRGMGFHPKCREFFSRSTSEEEVRKGK